MKSYSKLFFILLVITQFGCNEETIGLNEPQNYSTLRPLGIRTVCDLMSTATNSQVITGVKAINLPNGITVPTTNNILVFPTLQSYENTIDQLDALIDTHNDSFDQLTTGMTDEQADDYATQTGFDENLPLKNFENDLKFYSLRMKIEPAEDNWLNQQGDGVWNPETDPDSHYIDDDTERAMLNLGSEFIVGDCKVGNLTLYKMYEWGYFYMDITNISVIDISNFLTLLNTLPGSNSIHGPSESDVKNIIKNTGIGNTISNPTNNSGANCHNEVSDDGFHEFNSSRRIKWKQRFKAHWIDGNMKKVKVKTNSYRKKNGKWKKFRSQLYSGYYGYTYTNCTQNLFEENGKSKRRKKLKYKHLLPNLSGLIMQTNQNQLLSKHTQEGNIYTNDIY